MKTNKLRKIVILALFAVVIFADLYITTEQENNSKDVTVNNQISYEIADIPEYNGEMYILINNNNPTFSDEDMNIEQDYYSKLENGRVRNGYDKNLLEKSK